MANPKPQSIKIIGGELGGRTMRYPERRILRPTMGKVRESVFNTLDPYITGAVFVDLYSGAGAMGIEALSRGARIVRFVENAPEIVAQLRDNIEDLSGDLSAECVVHEEDVMAFLAGPLVEPGRIIYADPPYGTGLAQRVLDHFSGSTIALPEMLVIEHRSELEIEQPMRMDLSNEKKFGETIVSYFEPGGAR